MGKGAYAMVAGAIVIGLAGWIQSSSAIKNGQAGKASVVIARGHFGDGTRYRISGTAERVPGRTALDVQTAIGARGGLGAYALRPSRHTKVAIGGVRECATSGQYVVLGLLGSASTYSHIVAIGPDGQRARVVVPALPTALRIHGWIFGYAALRWLPRRVVMQPVAGTARHAISVYLPEGDPCRPGEGETFGSI